MNSLEYKLAIAMEPNFSWSYYNLALIYAKIEQKEKALRYLAMAIELDKNNKKEAYEDRDFNVIRWNKEFVNVVYNGNWVHKLYDDCANPIKRLWRKYLKFMTQ